MDVTSGIPTYSVTGVREAALAAHVGRRMAITGTIERARTTPLLTTADGARSGAVATTEAGGAGVTPEGASVHEAADAAVFIPISAKTRSLNIAQAATAGLAEALRQTGRFPRGNAA